MHRPKRLNRTGKMKMTGSALSNSCPADPEGRRFAADIVGYLFGHAQLTNSRVLALVGDPFDEATLNRWTLISFAAISYLLLL